MDSLVTDYAKLAKPVKRMITTTINKH